MIDTRPHTVLVFALLLLAGSSMVFAQTVPGSSPQEPPASLGAPQGAGFPVTGRVVCADTQRAARFASVMLIPAQAEGPGVRRFFTRTDLDGNFALNNVPAGDYYITASLTGYINTAGQVQSALASGSDPSSIPGTSLIHVSAGGSSAAISLQRGAVLQGTVQWDDGSPAAGINVSAQPVTSGANTANPPEGRFFAGGSLGSYNGAQTDDRGHFRISGLPAGPYTLRANLQAAAPQGASDRGTGRTLNLAVYAPNKLRRSEATVLTLTAGEERSDVNVVLGLAGLHTVNGVVSSPGAAVRSGTVNLSDQSDSSLTRFGTIGSDGGFVVPYVPAGTYTLRVSASSQSASFGRSGQSSDPLIRFQPFQESVTVTDGDLSGLAITVTAANPAP